MQKHEDESRVFRDAEAADVDALADALIQAEASATTDAAARAQGMADLDHVDALMEDVYAEGRRLARLGDSILMVSVDGLKAFVVGQVPDGTTFEQFMGLLREHGIVYGVKQNGIHRVLPQKRSRGRSARPRATDGTTEVVIAEGEPPVAPRDTRIKYRFPVPDAKESAEVNQIFAESSINRLQRCRVSLPLVAPGQELAIVSKEGGEHGWDVFGEKVDPDLPEEMAISVGDNVLLAPDGSRCTSEIIGYVQLIDDQITVSSPLWVARNLMSASFVFLPQSREFTAPEPDDVQALLEVEEVVHGIDSKAIDDLCRTLKEGGRETPRTTTVARGTEATPGQDAEWRFLFDPQLTRYFPEIRRLIQRSPSVDYLENYCEGSRPIFS